MNDYIKIRIQVHFSRLIFVVVYNTLPFYSLFYLEPIIIIKSFALHDIKERGKDSFLLFYYLKCVESYINYILYSTIKMV